MANVVEDIRINTLAGIEGAAGTEVGEPDWEELEDATALINPDDESMQSRG